MGMESPSNQKGGRRSFPHGERRARTFYLGLTGWMTGFAFFLYLGSLLRFGLGNDASGVNLQCDAFASQTSKDSSMLVDTNEQTKKALIETMSFEAMLSKVKTADGFLAALDQSGGSTPKALRMYGIPDSVSPERVC